VELVKSFHLSLNHVIGVHAHHMMWKLVPALKWRSSNGLTSRRRPRAAPRPPARWDTSGAAARSSGATRPGPPFRALRTRTRGEPASTTWRGSRSNRHGASGWRANQKPPHDHLTPCCVRVAWELWETMCNSVSTYLKDVYSYFMYKY